MKEYYEKSVGKEYQKVLKKQINGMYQTTKEGRFFYTQGYSYKSYIVDVTGLSNEEAEKKIENFQKQNFINISIGKLKYLTLQEIEVRIREGWKTILPKNQDQAKENLIRVFDSWITHPENDRDNASIIHRRALATIEKLPMPISSGTTSGNGGNEQPTKGISKVGILSNDLQPMLKNAVPRKLSMVEAKEKEIHPDFFNMFLADHKNKIEILISCLMQLGLIDESEQWDHSQLSFRGPVADYCHNNHWIVRTSETARDIVFAKRFKLADKLQRRVTRKKNRKSYLDRINKIDEIVKHLMKT